MRRSVLFGLAVLGLCLPCSSSDAGPGRHHKGCKGGYAAESDYGSAECGYVTETRTILVPETVTELRPTTVTEYRPEVRTRAVTRYRTVPVTEQVPYTYTVCESQVRTRTETYTELVAVTQPETRTFTVTVPHQEQRTATRRVAQTVPTVEARTVTRDVGHWESRTVCRPAEVASYGPRHGRCGRKHKRGCGEDCCYDGCGAEGGCAPAMVTSVERFWVPNVVTVTENVTVNRVQYVEQPFTYTVTVCRPEARTETVNVTRMVPQQRAREVSYTVSVPRTVTTTRAVTTCRSEAYQATESFTVSVPVPVQRQVPVRVCRMVPRTIQVRVPAPAPVVPCESAAPASGPGCCH